MCRTVLSTPNVCDTRAKFALRAGSCSVALGDQYTMMLKKDGSVWTTGDNKYGQLGDGSTVESFKFLQVFKS